MTPVSLTRRAALALGLLLVNTGADTALADGLGEPQGRVNLTIAGKVGQPDRGNEAPFDSKAEWRSSTYHERSIWQLKRMGIE